MKNFIKALVTEVHVIFLSGITLGKCMLIHISVSKN